MGGLRLARLLGVSAGLAGCGAAATDWPQLQFSRVYSGVSLPTLITNAGDGSGRLFITEQAGRIRVARSGVLLAKPFLDIGTRVSCCGEQGLLSVAFPPGYAAKGYFYVDYTDPGGTTTISRFSVTSDPDLADPNSEAVILRIAQPFTNHNGGLLQFGPDGYLYIGHGDGGGGGDPQGNGQKLSTMLGKLLRIDVESGVQPYRIPPGNPFAANPQALPEIWAYGLRNPWKFSFDRQTGDLYIADVGQNFWEEIDFQPASSRGGEDYGWNITEGNHCYLNPACSFGSLTMPVAEYSHADGCAVVGGNVYRGTRNPAWQGVYFYGDYCSGNIWGLRQVAGQWQSALIARTGSQITSFGQDEQGELYVTDQAVGEIYLLAPLTVGNLSVTPNSGLGIGGTFQFQASDAAGYTDLAAIEVIISTGFSASGACYLRYEQAGNRLWLVDDAGRQFTGPATPGVPGTLRNSQCTVNAGSVTVVGSGPTLTLTAAVTFTAAFSGNKSVYLWAISASGQASGYQQRGTWSVTTLGVPAVGAVTPASGSGTSGSFQMLISDTAGYRDIAAVEMIIGLSTAQSCYVRYERISNLLWLTNDASNLFTGPVTPGTAGTLSNSQCSLNAAPATVSGTGNTLIVTVPLTFTGPFEGAKLIYLWAASTGGQNTGYQQVGTWTVSHLAVAPTPVSVTPSSGSGSSTTLQFVASDVAGFADIAAMETIVGPIGAQGCYLRYERTANRLFLVNDAGTQFMGPATPGVAGTLSNSQCSLNAAGATAVGAGNTLTLTVPLVFTAAFAGAKNVFLWAAPVGGQTSGYQQVGTWTVTGASSVPTAVSVTPASGSGASGSFQFVVSSAAGFANIAAMEAIVGPIGAQGCYLRYERAANRLFLVSDAGTQFMGPATPGVAGTLSNSQCSLNAAGAAVAGSGNTLTLTVPLTFTVAFTGSKRVYLWAASAGGQISGYQQVGTWTVP
jgi:glucose/arabinose dehydrogenase